MNLPIVLKSCPFCGFVLDIEDEDCIYPATRPEYDKNTDSMIYGLYEINCYEVGGGCGASILGSTPADCINKWNTRTH
ncbi:hypothetical protein M0R04_07215 [Candidatus Dojkabacteria bacterium]|jgi:hypothetical protein|nr:hypothetical protein [Candidatus Dojkabacteria bacterium]